MSAIRVMIVEDQSLVAEFIASKLKQHGIEAAAIVDSGEEALKVVQSSSPDLVLMDIQLAGAMDGISTAQILRDQHQIPVIFLTDSSDQSTFDRAKKTAPANYLTKPFNEQDLVRAIDLAFLNARSAGNSGRRKLDDFVFVRTDNQAYLKVAIDDILYLKADRAYCDLVTVNGTHTLSTSMNHVHEQIQHGDFMKVYRSYVVNIKKIKSIDGRMVRIGTTMIKVSDEQFDLLMERIKLVK